MSGKTICQAVIAVIAAARTQYPPSFFKEGLGVVRLTRMAADVIC